MADIFISYGREDRETAKTLAQALADQGWSVWWDRHIPSGRRFHEVIEYELAAARCVIVLWSKAALGSQWVREEAQAGLDRDILVPVRIEAIPLPIGFRSIQTADLVGWEGDQAHPGFAQLVEDVTSALGKAPPKERVVELKAKPEKPVERGAEPEANKPVKPRNLPADTFQKLTRPSLLLIGLLLSLGAVATFMVVPSRDAVPPVAPEQPTAPPSQAAPAILPGRYSVSGVNPDATVYTGTAEIARSGDSYIVTEWIGNDIFHGAGTVSGGKLEVRFETGYLANYTVAPDGTITGVWSLNNLTGWEILKQLPAP